MPYLSTREVIEGIARKHARGISFLGKSTMRVIKGIFKGRRLLSPKGHYLRPTSDRVKESIFNILSRYISDAIVLDLFAGTGSLSIEAFSCGAKKVLAVEKHQSSLKIIYDNLTNLQITKQEIQVSKNDVFIFLKRYKQALKFDLIFIDPPFIQKLADVTMKQLAKSSTFKKTTIIVIESSRHEMIQDHYDPFRVFDRRYFGDKWVSFFKTMDLKNIH